MSTIEAVTAGSRPASAGLQPLSNHAAHSGLPSQSRAVAENVDEPTTVAGQRTPHPVIVPERAGFGAAGDGAAVMVMAATATMAARQMRMLLVMDRTMRPGVDRDIPEPQGSRVPTLSGR
jgi:hypothetical protein